MTLAALWLAGCASIEVQGVAGEPLQLQTHVRTPGPAQAALQQAPECCGSLGELPFQELAEGGRRKLAIGSDAPVFRFDTGKSHFAAFRIAALPRPARIELSSFRSAEPGSVLQTVMPDTRQAVLQPTVLLLDEQFRLVRRVDAREPLSDCATTWAAPVFNLALLVGESAREVAYLVIMSTAEAMAREGQKVCGLVRHGMSPTGELQLQVRTLPAGDAPLRAVLPVKWYADTRGAADVSFLQFLLAQPRLLALGQHRLEVLEADGARYRPLLTVPYADVVRVTPGGASAQARDSLVVTALEPAADRAQAPKLRHHTFELDHALQEGLPQPEQLAQLLAADLAQVRATQTVAWNVSPQAPVLAVQGGAASRIGRTAVAGGMVTAMPCGVCQGGVCPPEVLGPCAALFGVGALLGGATGMVKEILSGARTPDAQSQLKSLAQAQPAFAPVRLQQCLAAELVRRGGAPWRDAGIAARSVLADGTSAGDHVAEASLRELVLARAGAGKDAPAEERWELRMEARLQFTESSSGRRATRDVQWTSAAHPPAAWTDPEARLLAEVTGAGCAAIAQRLLQAAEMAWRAP